MSLELNKVDGIMLLLFFIALGVFPWQLHFYDETLYKIHKILSVSAWLIPLIHALIKVKNIKFLGVFRVLVMLGIIYGSVLISDQILNSPPKQSIYMELYSNPDDENENIRIMYNHASGMTNWHETKHYISFPQLGLRIERKFNQKNLQGTWFVHDGNSFSQEKGIVSFKNGIALTEN